MRLATYNVEWFNALFSRNNEPLLDNEWSGRRDVTRRQQLEALATVMRGIKADAIMIVEGPDTEGTRDTKTALLNFAAFADLPFDAVLHGYRNDTQQEIALLYRSSMFEAVHDPQASDDDPSHAPGFETEFSWDVDVDGKPEVHRFSKPPLEVALRLKDHDTDLRLIGVHVKSKAPHGARTPKEEVTISIANRRKQLAQCLWLRRRVEAHLASQDHVIVMGDFNDGPGLDEYEKLFGRSGVEVVLGTTEPEDTQLFDPHADARLDPRNPWSPSSARFYLYRKETYLNALLDYAMVSPSVLHQFNPSWNIWHPFDHAGCYASEDMRRALLVASDHFPVTLDLQV